MSESASAAYGRRVESYRALVASYVSEVRRAIQYLDGFFPDWGRIITTPGPRHPVPPRPQTDEIELAFQGFDSDRIITAARLAELIADLTAAWDDLNDTYAGLGETEKVGSIMPADVHRRATTIEPMPEPGES